MGFGTTNEAGDVGNWETCSVQSRRRVVLSKEFMESVGIEVGDEIIAVCKDNKIELRPSDAETLKELGEELE